MGVNFPACSDRSREVEHNNGSTNAWHWMFNFALCDIGLEFMNAIACKGFVNRLRIMRRMAVARDIFLFIGKAYGMQRFAKRLNF